MALVEELSCTSVLEGFRKEEDSKRELPAGIGPGKDKILSWSREKGQS